VDLEGVEIGPHRFVWTISNGWDFYMSLWLDVFFYSNYFKHAWHANSLARFSKILVVNICWEIIWRILCFKCLIILPYFLWGLHYSLWIPKIILCALAYCKDCLDGLKLLYIKLWMHHSRDRHNDHWTKTWIPY
jgi:hypothetical protein